MSRAAVDEVIAALADPARRAVVDALRSGPRRAGELAAAVRLSPARTSQHLRVLRKSGVIAAEGLGEDARVKLYRLRPAPFVTLGGWLDEVAKYWRLELAAFKAHAERARPRRRT